MFKNAVEKQGFRIKTLKLHRTLEISAPIGCFTGFSFEKKILYDYQSYGRTF